MARTVTIEEAEDGSITLSIFEEFEFNDMDEALDFQKLLLSDEPFEAEIYTFTPDRLKSIKGDKE